VVPVQVGGTWSSWKLKRFIRTVHPLMQVARLRVCDRYIELAAMKDGKIAAEATLERDEFELLAPWIEVD